MGEIKNPENSGVSDPSGDEQTGDGEDKKIPVTENEEEQSPEGNESEDDQDVSDDTEAGSGEELTDEKKPVDSLTEISGAQTDAVEDTDSVITVEYKKASEEDTATSAAEVVFLGGCVSSENKLAKDRDLKFKVEPAAGRVVTKVERQIGDAAAATEVTSTSGVYTVEKSMFVNGTTALSGKIIVTTKAVEYSVTFSDDSTGVASSYDVYLVTKNDAGADVLEDAAVASATAVTYGESKKFAVTVKDNEANKFVGLTLEGEPIETTKATLNKKSDGADADKTECFTFTVDPSKAAGLGNATADTAASVKVKVVAKAVLTVAFDGDNDNSTVDTSVANTSDTFINYTGGKFGTDSTFGEGSEDLAKSLAFKVTPEENYKVAEITAKATTDTDTDGTAVDVTSVAVDDGSVECTIALGQEALKFSENTTLTISIAAELDDTKETVHKINFKDKGGNAPAHVTIKHGAASADTALTDTSVTVPDASADAGTTYMIKVTPDAGYDLAKGTITTGDDKNDDKFVVTLKETRVYDGITAPVTIETEVEAVNSSNEAQELTLILKDTTGDTAYEEDASEAKAYRVTSVDVVIDTKVQKNTAEKIVTFTDSLGAGYDITTQGIILDEEAAEGAEEDTWVVPKTVDVLTFTVTSGREPVATLDENTDIESSAAEDVYTFNVPAKLIKDDGTSAIVISEKTAAEEKNVMVKVVKGDVTVYYEDADTTKAEESLGGEADADGFYTLTHQPTEGDEGVILTFEPKPGVTIDKVSYKMGEETTGEATPDRQGNVELSLPAITGDVTVEVESKSDYRVVLTNSGDELAYVDGAYVADYTDTDIDIKLVKAGVDYAKALYDVVVKDGAKTAATEATVSGATARIASIAKSERGTDLTIEVYINKSTKYTTTLKTNAESDAVKVTRMVNGKAAAVAEDATVEIMPDAEMEFTVAPVGKASLSDLRVEVLQKDGTAFAADASPVVGTPSINEEGILTITTKTGVAKDTEALVSIYNVNEEKAQGVTKNTSLKGGKFVLKLTDPLVKTAEITKVNAAAGSGTNRDVRLNVSVDFKNKKNPPAAPIEGDLYYKVELTAPEGAPASVTVISGESLVQYYKVEDFENTSLPITIPVVVSNSEDTPQGVVADIAEVISTTAKVTLVQSTKKVPAAAADYVTGPVAAMKDSTLSTKAPVYETKLTVKAVNRSTVLTGQQDVKVATPVFGKTTAFDGDITVRFVDTKSGVLRGTAGTYEGDEAAYGSYFKAWVDAADNSIHVGITSASVRASDYKTLGVKVTAKAPDGSYAASAVVKLKIQQGIYSVDVDESKAALPDTLFKNSSNKPSFKITAKLNEGNKDYKPAKSAVEWKIAPAAGNSSNYAKAAVQGAKPLVSVKNGTVSVAKDYKVQPGTNDNKFTVTIKANDFADNNERETVNFEITEQKDVIDKLVVVNASGEVQDPAALTAEEFDYWNHETNNGQDRRKYLYVRALRKDAKAPYSSDDFLPVTFKSSNAKALAVNTATGLLTFYKPADRIKITATTVDGGKAPKAELTINVKPYKQVCLLLEDLNDLRNDPVKGEDIHYSGGSNEKYEVYAAYQAGDGWCGAQYYKNLKVTVKNGKFYANKNWAKYGGNHMGYVIVTGGKDEATVTVTDTANKNKDTNHKDYKIVNDSNSSVKAPGIKLYDPKKVTRDTESITWQVTDKNKDNYAGKYVKLMPDFTVARKDSVYDAYDLLNYDSYYGTCNGEILKINEDGRFTLDGVDLDHDQAGAYKMIATVGEMVGGEFVASAKDVKLNFSVPKTNRKTTLTVKNSYTLDVKSASKVWIDVKSDYVYEVSDAMSVVKKEQGKNDHTNRFTEFFEVEEVTNDRGRTVGYTIGLKPGLSKEAIDDITSKDSKDDCTGYITVSNGTGSMGSVSSKLNTKDVQVKISFKENKYSLTGATIFSNGTATTPVKATVSLMNGKLRDRAALVGVSTEDDGNFVDKNNQNAITFSDNGDIIINSKAAAIAPGKYNVKLIVIPQDSSYVKWVKDDTNPNGGRWIYANDKTENGTALTQEALVAAAGIPVTATINVKAVDTKSIAKAKSLNVTLGTRLYDEENGNGYVRGAAGTSGYYQVDVPYTIATDGSDIDATETKKMKVNLMAKDGTTDQNKIPVTGGTEDLVKVSKETVTDSKGNTVPVIRLQVSKKALTALTAMAPADKPITAYGKKLSVPVEVQYTNGITTTDTLKFNITMPKKAPVDYSGVKTLITENEDAIKKIQTKLHLSNAEEELQDLYQAVYDKVDSLIPADTDVMVQYVEAADLTKKQINDGQEVPDGEIANAPAYDEIMDAGTAKITLTLVDMSKASSNTEDMGWNYTLALNKGTSDAEDLASLVSDACDAITFTNDINTGSKLLAEIKKNDEVKDYLNTAKGRHLSIKVAYFDIQPATIKADGSIWTGIQVKDLVTGHCEWVEYNDDYSNTITIGRLSTLSEAKTEVSKLFDSDTKVKAYLDAYSGQVTLMQAAIRKAAEEAAGNKEITIAFKADTEDEKGWDYVAATEAEGENAAAPGHLQFTLILTKPQTTGTRSTEITSAKYDIPADDAGKYVSVTDAKTKIETAVLGTDNATLIATVKGASSNVADDIKQAIAAAFDAEITNYAGYEWSWAQTADEEDNFTYSPASQLEDGKVSFTIDLKLTAAAEANMDGATATITVTNVAAVDADDSYQTAAELADLIKALGTETAPITAATVPADKAAAKTALEDAIAGVNKASDPAAITVKVTEIAEAEGVTGTAYVTTPAEGDATAGVYSNVKITIGEDDDTIEFTQTFNFAKTATD